MRWRREALAALVLRFVLPAACVSHASGSRHGNEDSKRQIEADAEDAAAGEEGKEAPAVKR